MSILGRFIPSQVSYLSSYPTLSRGLAGQDNLHPCLTSFCIPATVKMLYGTYYRVARRGHNLWSMLPVFPSAEDVGSSPYDTVFRA